MLQSRSTTNSTPIWQTTSANLNSQQPIALNGRQQKNDYQLLSRDFKHISKTTDNKYIILAITDSIPTYKQAGSGRKCKVNHSRTDTLPSMIGCLLRHKPTIPSNHP